MGAQRFLLAVSISLGRVNGTSERSQTMHCFNCSQILHAPYATICGHPPINLHPECLGPLVERIIGEASFFSVDTDRLGTPMKVWLNREADKHGVGTQAIYTRVTRNPEKYYPHVHLTKVNKRVVLVTERTA